MKIAFFLDQDFPPDARVENEALTLMESGHEVFIFSINNKENSAISTYKGIKIHHYGGKKYLKSLYGLAYTFPFYHWIIRKGIKQFLDKINPDVLHIHDMVLAKEVFRINKSYKKPTVLDLHENRPEIMKSYGFVNTVLGRILIYPRVWEFFQRRFAKKTDHLILVTQQSKEQFARDYEIETGKINVVPNSVRKSFYTDLIFDLHIQEKLKDRFNVLYIGDTGLRRGTDTLIKSIPFLKDKIENLQIVIVGKSKEDYLLKKLSKDINVEKYVLFEGWQQPNLLPTYIKYSQIGVSPLKRNKHHDTTYANKVFQYLSLGLPIVVSDCPPQTKIVQDYICGMVHLADNEIDLSDKILELFLDEHQRKVYSSNGVEAIDSSLNWESLSSNLVNLYSKIEQAH